MKSIYVMVLATICIFAAQANAWVLFQDNFDGYTTSGTLDATAAWSNSNGRFFVGDSGYAGQCRYYNNVAAGPMGIAAVDGVNSYYIKGVPQANYVVNCDVVPVVGANKAECYVMGRINGTNWIGCDVYTSSTDLYVVLKDSVTGSVSSLTKAGTYDGNNPVHVKLDINNGNLTVTVTNGLNVNKTVYGVTTVTSAGAPGIGAYSSGYAVALFDNFQVISSGPQTCADVTVFDPADFNHDCYVDLKDVAVFVSQWMLCSTPGNASCTQ